MSELLFDSSTLHPGHRLRLLRDGAEAYPRMLEAIAAARRFILLETYTFADDAVGRKFGDALIERARAGVAVRVMYDAMGSKDTPRDFFGELRAAGCVVNEYNPISRSFAGGFRGRRRNHRKLLVIDGLVAFAGGLNLAREYAQGWRDTAVEICGPVVHEMGRMFLAIWEREEHRSPQIDLPPPPPSSGGAEAQVLSSHRWGARWRMARAYQWALDHARSRIWIANAYFVPTRKFLRSLRRAAARGVDVRIIVPAHTDIMPVYYATRAYFTRLLKWGLRIFEWQGPMMHAKTCVIDGEWSKVGSYNIDHLSLFRNLELAVIVMDKEFGATMEHMFEADTSACHEVDRAAWSRRPWTQRLLEWFFHLFRTFL